MMAERNYFAHASPEGYEVWDRLEMYNITDWSYAGENIYSSEGLSTEPRYIVSSWMKSIPHYQNAMNPPYTETGVGICKSGGETYVTQVFTG